MVRRLVLAVCAAAWVVAVRAEAPPAGEAKGRIEEAALQQELLKRRYDDFKYSLIRLAQRLEMSQKLEDRDRAKKLRAAIKKAAEEGVESRFATLVDALRTGNVFADLERLEEVLKENEELRRELRGLMAILMGEDRARQLHDDMERYGRLLQEIKRLIGKQDRLQTLTGMGRTDLKNILDGQKKVSEETRRLADPKARPDADPVRKEIARAAKYQRQAEDDLDRGRRDQGEDNQGRAGRELEKARDRLVERLRQLREEEIAVLLEQLEARCRHLLAIQTVVREGTVVLDRAIQRNPDRKPARADSQTSLTLSDREQEVARRAADTLRLIEAEGSAVAFAEVFRQLHSDMVTVTGRLRRSDAGTVTVAIEDDVIATLEETIEALKKARQRAEGRRADPAAPATRQDPQLIDRSAELKMIRSMQQRVNARTEVYGRQYPGEQAPPAAAARSDDEREQYESIRRELKDLAGRQGKIGRATHDIAAGKAEAR
jgi:hypothetical protein